MIGRRGGLWLLAVILTPLTVAVLVITLIEREGWMLTWVVPAVLITVVVDTWLVRELTGRSRPPG